MGYSNLYKLPLDQRPFYSDTELLDSYNASMFTEFREVNMGTLDAFMYDYESEFNQGWLESQGMSSALANSILKLGDLYRTRTQALNGKSTRCTIFSRSAGGQLGSFTAQQISNADGTETMQSYANLFEDIAAERTANMQAIGRLTLERLFPEARQNLRPSNGCGSLKSCYETRPAMMMDTLISALDEVTGTTAASVKVKDAIVKQPTVGGVMPPANRSGIPTKHKYLKCGTRYGLL